MNLSQCKANGSFLYTPGLCTAPALIPEFPQRDLNKYLKSRLNTTHVSTIHFYRLLTIVTTQPVGFIAACPVIVYKHYQQPG